MEPGERKPEKYGPKRLAWKQNLKPLLQETWLSSDKDPRNRQAKCQSWSPEQSTAGGRTWNSREAFQSSPEAPNLRLSLSIHCTTLLSHPTTSFLRARTMFIIPMLPVPGTWLGIMSMKQKHLGNACSSSRRKDTKTTGALTFNEPSFLKALKTGIYIHASIIHLLPGHHPTRSQQWHPGMGDTAVESSTLKGKDGGPKTHHTQVSNHASRDRGPPFSYLGGYRGLCIGRLDKERNPAPLPVIEDHLPHSPHVRLSTLKCRRKRPN